MIWKVIRFSYKIIQLCTTFQYTINSTILVHTHYTHLQVPLLFHRSVYWFVWSCHTLQDPDSLEVSLKVLQLGIGCLPSRSSNGHYPQNNNNHVHILSVEFFQQFRFKIECNTSRILLVCDNYGSEAILTKITMTHVIYESLFRRSSYPREKRSVSPKDSFAV